MVRADVYLPRNSAGPFPVLLGASPYQKSLRHLPPVPATFPFIEYGPMQPYLDEGYAYVAMDTPGMADPKGCGTPFRAPRARRERTKKSILEVDIRASGERRETIGVGGIDWKRDRIRGLGNEFDCGGGTFIAFPTLVSVIGMTEKAANATCTVGLWPGYAAAIGAAREDLAKEPRELLKGLMLVSAIGG